MHLNLLLLEGMNGKLKRFLGSKALFRSDFRVQRVIFSRGLKLFYATREERGWKGSFFRGGVISRNIAPVFRYSSLRMEFECATPESKRFSLSLDGQERERGTGKLNAVNRDPVNRPFPCQEVRQAARLMGLMIHRGLTSWININYDVFLCKRPCKWDTSAPRRGLYILCYIYIYIYMASGRGGELTRSVGGSLATPHCLPTFPLSNLYRLNLTERLGERPPIKRSKVKRKGLARNRGWKK